MCLLIFAKGGATPSKESLRIAARANPDGFGFAIVTDKNTIHRFRSMDIEETITAFFDARKRYPKSHAIFHLRITTHGATNIDNCHPFRVSDDVVMGHNGMLPIKEENGRSDTRIFAEDWLPELGVKALLDDKDGMKELEKFIGYSKLAFLNVGDELDKPYYIVNENLGHWKHGVWYSNHSYEPIVRYANPIGRTWSSHTSWTPPYYDDEDPSDRLMPDYRSYDETLTAYDTVYGRTSYRDLAFCEERMLWLPIDEVENFSLVQWRCNECNHEEIYDVDTDEPDFCPHCQVCYYCGLDRGWCTCASDYELAYGDNMEGGEL